MSPRTTLIVSSYNGAATLPTMLDALSNINVPRGGLQVILVDNNSNDATSSILRKYAGEFGWTALFCERRGKNCALNFALESAVGDLVVFSDDDIVPDKDWLVTLADEAEKRLDYSIFSGAIVPRWPVSPPDWLTSWGLPLGMLYAVTDSNLRSGEVDSGQVWGPNMAIRKSVFDSGLRFDESVGPDGSMNYMMGSETEFTRRLAGLGFKSYFCSDAVVEHMVRPWQMDKKWVLQRFFRAGRSGCAQDRSRSRPGALIFGVERWVIGKVIRSALLSAWFSVRGRDRESFVERTSVRFFSGYIFQSRLLSKSGD